MDGEQALQVLRTRLDDAIEAEPPPDALDLLGQSRAGRSLAEEPEPLVRVSTVDQIIRGLQAELRAAPVDAPPDHYRAGAIDAFDVSIHEVEAVNARAFRNTPPLDVLAGIMKRLAVRRGKATRGERFTDR